MTGIRTSFEFLCWMCRLKWVDGEKLQALAYDVPIPGYGKKNTISLCLWEAKASSHDFNLYAFNERKYEHVAHIHSKAQHVQFVKD